MSTTQKFKKFAISLVELFDRTVALDKNTNVYLNDIDNLYPNRMEIAEKNSKTANSCANKLGQYIFGQGFQNPELKVNGRGGAELTLNDCLALVVNSVKTHRAAFIHLNYDIEGKVNYFDVLDYKKCRISKIDHFGYSGNVVYKDWAKKDSIFNFNEKNVQWFYPYNPKNVQAQREKDTPNPKTAEDIIRNYRGQVLFFNLDPTNIYPYSWLIGQAVLDADSEYRLSLYRNNSIRKGFQDKTMFILNGFDKKTKEDFDKDSRAWLGAENSGSIFTFNTSEYVDNPEKLIVPIQLKSSYDSKKFEKDEEAFEDSISKCYLDIPKVLIDDRNGGVFGTSGSAIEEAQKLYSKGTKSIREKLEGLFKTIFDIENVIVPIVPESDIDGADQTRLQSQATLKGSVGGVTALLDVIKAVNANEISAESAVEIIKEIYGVSEELALKMLAPTKKPTVEPTE